MAKRISLREFQAGLVERLTSAARGESSTALLGVQAGKTHWLLNLSDAGEILPLPPLTPVPRTRHWFVGMANIRGVLYGVVDFSAFLGGEPTQRNHEARLLLVGARHGMNCALLVSRTLGLKNPETFEISGLAHVPGETTPVWTGEALRDKQTGGQQIWHRLLVKPLLGDAAFLDVSR